MDKPGIIRFDLCRNALNRAGDFEAILACARTPVEKNVAMR